MTFDFHDRHVLVTGGTSGIGEALGVAFAQAGATVTCVGIDDDQVRAFKATHPDIRAAWMDVTSDASISQVIDPIPRLDVLINAAGIIHRGHEHEPEGFARVIDVNLNGVMRMCVASKSRLIESQGCVLNIASMLTFFGSGPAPAYAASKGGVGQLTKSLAISWASEGVRVNAIAPGWIQTPLTQALQDDPARSKAITDRTPMNRWGQARELSPAAMFLCSPEAGFITGAILPVDGGYSAM